MKVYEFEGFPNPARVRIALKEKGLFDRVEFVSVNVPAGDHRKPEFLAINPSGTVPVLELDDGTYIAECTAITEYIDHLDNAGSLTGVMPKERAVIAMMQRRVEAGLLDAVGTYFHQATEGLGPELEGEQCPEWGHRQREKALDSMHYLDGVLQDQDYIAGDKFSVADITAYAAMGFAAFAEISTPDGLTNLTDWQARIDGRPST